MTKILFVFLFLFSISYADNAVILGFSGKPQILKKSQGGNEKLIMYEGKKYYEFNPKLGLKLDNGDFILCLTNCQVRLVFTNGDQFFIGPNTSFQVPLTNKKEESTSDLIYGKIRAIISSKGPRKNYKIEMKTGTAGIRGTDFFIQSGANKESKISVLRGKIVFDSPAKKNIEIPSHKSLEMKSEKEIVKKSITKSDLDFVKKTSTLPPQNLSNLNEDQKKNFETLENKGKENVLSDVKKYDPEMYEKLSQNKNLTLNELDQSNFNELREAAPEVSEVEDILNLENKVDENYKKFIDN